MDQKFAALRAKVDGEVYTDRVRKILYATDASDYKEYPLAVACPHHAEDIRELVRFARDNKLSLVPRAAGTSLAGQVVGSGIVVDVSQHMTKILELNTEEKWVRVQPGVILDDLNTYLAPYGLFFGPETSTASRSMIGGMIGNNSCGLHSLVYGSTRDHTISVSAILSDASTAEFGPINTGQFKQKLKLEGAEGDIYRGLHDILSDAGNQKEIEEHFPDPAVVRRNTGYALDELMACSIYRDKEAKYQDYNLCRLLSGSEGTLLFMTEARLNLLPLPPANKALVPVHFPSLEEAIRGNLVALRHKPTAVELMDKTILDCTKENLSQRRNRFFLDGDPAAILMIELADDKEQNLLNRIKAMVEDFRKQELGYHFPVVRGGDISRVWALRKAGLGVLSNIPGDGRPVSVIEDTSVKVEDLEAYISDFKAILKRFDLECVYHAHISVGELHLRPVLNLKDPAHVDLFHEIALESARLVKKYKGSLSGEHGDGRLRGEFIPLMVGEHNYKLFRYVKRLFDPENIFNPGKITDTPPMNSSLRYDPGFTSPEYETLMDFSGEGGLMKLIEKCNGSGDCRKTQLSGGTMCPSYMATRDEITSTRARANVLRELLSQKDIKRPFDQEEIYQVLDLCLGCKACKSECPSGVDMAKIKAEFLHQWYRHHPPSLRTRLIAHISSINKMGMIWPGFFNLVVNNKLSSRLLKSILGFGLRRSIPNLEKISLRKWAKRNLKDLNSGLESGSPEVLLFVDEFTNYNDTALGITTIRLLNKLGVRVLVHKHSLSGRTFISKGLLVKAAAIAQKNVKTLAPLVGPERPLIGIEPSAILSFRDEYPELVGKELKKEAEKLSDQSYLLEEYLLKLFEKNGFGKELFTDKKAQLKLHGHCQQKAISSTAPTLKVLSIPKNYSVTEIPSGCCGMAGSFGYEKEHYDLSMSVGELVLFPAVREAGKETILVAAGTSCRHQIKDGTGRKALHPAEILYRALK